MNKQPDFLIHDDNDSVGVIVVETVKAGDTLRGLDMHSGAEQEIVAQATIPLGHKIALHDIGSGADIMKYGYPIGRAVSQIERGQHVHVHNIKTKKW